MYRNRYDFNSNKCTLEEEMSPDEGVSSQGPHSRKESVYFGQNPYTSGAFGGTRPLPSGKKQRHVSDLTSPAAYGNSTAQQQFHNYY